MTAVRSKAELQIQKSKVSHWVMMAANLFGGVHFMLPAKIDQETKD